MASTAEHHGINTTANGTSHSHSHGGVNGSSGGLPRKGLLAQSPASAAANRPPPSPPTTETDTEEAPSDSDIPRRTAATITTLDTAAAQTETSGLSDYYNNNDNMPDSPVTSPITSPPYWPNYSIHDGNDNGHGHHISNASVESLPTGGITLRDNENSSLDERGSYCWAKSVRVVDYTVINGGNGGSRSSGSIPGGGGYSSSSGANIAATLVAGAFVVYNIRVETLNGGYLNIRKRYSEFDDFRWRLIRTFPGFEAAVPELPPKSFISKFRPRFLEKRRAGLQYFLKCVLHLLSPSTTYFVMGVHAYVSPFIC
ncbi:hypothetical protein SLS62_003063 [Diatrype stigma]|uniref:Endosomal/vacuolar adapter protein YPT35 n=1 Tax=Diatrype stigma TaxID=117547 RepID=A0AAN9V5L1_9PEZI